MMKAASQAAAKSLQGNGEASAKVPVRAWYERSSVGLFSTVAFGLLAVVVAGGSVEYRGVFAMVALGMLVVGPVASEGLERAMKPIAALIAFLRSSNAELLESAAAAAPESSSADDCSSNSSAMPVAKQRKEKSSVAPPAAKSKDGAASVDTSELEKEQMSTPSAADLLVEVWQGMPKSEELRTGLKTKICNVPATMMGMPGDLLQFWVWLNRPRWKPFPWQYLPDPVAFAFGVLQMAFIAPIVIVEIVVTVPTMALLKAELAQARCKWIRTNIPEMVRSVSRPLGRLMMRDPRNHSYLPWMALLGIFTPALFFWAFNRHMKHGLEFSTLCIYHLLRVGPRFQLFAHAHTLVHKEGHAHKGFFKGPFRVLNCFTEWWIGPFYGVVPFSYYISHMKIHHRWHNDVDDVHTNLDLDRTNPLNFFIYTPRFFLYWSGLTPLALFIKRQEWALITKLLYGMVAYYGMMAFMFWWNWSFCVLYIVFPYMEASVALCAISYMWHAFVEETDPENQYVNSVTILNGHDNVWNEDYHVVHHHAPNTHWTDAPAHFEKHRADYAACNATIFQDTEEGKLLQCLFEKDWDTLAKHFVDLNGKMTHEEKKALIVKRLSYVVGERGRTGRRTEWGATSSIRDWQE